PPLTPPALGALAEPPDAGHGGAVGSRPADGRSHRDQPDAGGACLSGGRVARAAPPRSLAGLPASSARPARGPRGARRRALRARRSGSAGGPRADGVDERVLLPPVQAVRRSGRRGADRGSLLSPPRRPGGVGVARAAPGSPAA